MAVEEPEISSIDDEQGRNREMLEKKCSGC
jgi:hypothetical protein